MPDADVAPSGAGPSEPHLRAVQAWLGNRGVARTASLSVFVRNYRCTTAQTPDFQIESQRQRSPPHRADILRFTQATLRSGNEANTAHAEGKSVRMQVYETSSLQAAQAFSLELLTGFHSLPDSPPPSREIGDLDVMMPGDRIGLFTRGNLVVLLSALGPAASPISELARQVDAFLTRTATGASSGALTRTLTATSHSGTMVRYLAKDQQMLGQAMAKKATTEPTATANRTSEAPTQVAVYDDAQGNWVIAEGGGGTSTPTELPAPNTPSKKSRRRS